MSTSISPHGAGGPLARLIDMVNDRDLDRVDVVMSEDIQLHDVSLGETIKHRSALRTRLQQWLDAVPDGHIEVTSLVDAGDRAGAEILVRGTNAGPWEGLPPSGSAIELPVAVVSSSRDGAISLLRLYYDLATLLQAVGTL